MFFKEKSLRKINIYQKMMSFLFLITVIAVSFLPSDLSANGQPVYWGGVSFSGDWQERESLYPATSKLLNCKTNKICLDDLAREQFLKKEFKNFKLNTGKIKAKEVEGLVGVISISNEFFGTYQDWKTKNYFGIGRLFGQFLIYEFGTGMIIHNVPFAVRAVHDQPSPFSEKDKQDLFQRLVLANTGETNLFDEAYKKSKGLDPTNLPGKFTKIGKFDFTEAALNSFLAKDEKHFGSKFGQFFESELVGRTDAHFIPMSLGSSTLKNKLQLKFGDRSRELMVPAAAFEVDILVRMAKLFESNRGVQRTICPAVAITLNVASKIDTVTNLKFSIMKDACGVTSSEQKLNMRYRFSRSLFSLLQNMAKQFGMPDPSAEWLAKNAKGNDGKNVKEEIKKLRKEVFDADF